MVPACRCRRGCTSELKAVLRQEDGAPEARRPGREATKGLFCASHCINRHLYGRRGNQGSQRASHLQGHADKVVEAGSKEASGCRVCLLLYPHQSSWSRDDASAPSCPWLPCPIPPACILWAGSTRLCGSLPCIRNPPGERGPCCLHLSPRHPARAWP